MVGDAAVAAVEARASRRRASPRARCRAAPYAAKVIRRRVLGRPYEPFRYSDHGDVAVIGRLSGVTNIGWLGPFGRQGGFTAWLLWLGIHISYLIGFANRIVVLVRWAWTFLTHGRGTRLITGQPLLPPIEEPEPPVLAPARGRPTPTRRRDGRLAARQVDRKVVPSGPVDSTSIRPPFAARSSRAIVSPRPLPVGRPVAGSTARAGSAR